ncbi:MAG: RsmB/NOP family class I SAM-dependent RNA methyltransferase [Sphingomonadaceae bacterium]
MTPAARVQAAIDILNLVTAAARDNGPAADTIIADWFRTRRFAGSGDRRAVREHVYAAIRAYGDVPTSGRAAMVGLARRDPALAAWFDGTAYGPPCIGESETGDVLSLLPDWLARLVPETEHEALLGRAPFDLRVNALRSDRAAVMALLPGAEAIADTAYGLRLPDNVPLANRPELAGLVEVQDAGSQMVAAACRAAPGMTIVDLCAGAGGKTLALAADMANAGRLVACDTDRGRLSRIEPRAAVAGAAIIATRLLDPNRERVALADLAGSADCVLVDAPCSGSGTWRRNPELRWRLTQGRLKAVIELQSHVLDLGATLVKPGGALVYAVCSLIAAEGEGQVAAFLARHQGRSLELSRLLTPSRDGCDGFYFARLRNAC